MQDVNFRESPKGEVPLIGFLGSSGKDLVRSATVLPILSVALSLLGMLRSAG